MKPQFDHLVKSSFTLWLDNLLLRKGQTFKNFSTNLTQISNSEQAQFNIFKSPHAQWVYDDSIQGANIPDSVLIDSVSTPKSDLVIIDYNNGRVLIDKSVSASVVSASYAFKDIQVYQTQVAEQHLLFENSFKLNPRTKAPAPKNETDWMYPAIFVKYNPGKNDPYCLGGTDVTHPRLRVTLVMDSTYLFDGACGILRDTVRTGIPLLTGEEMPFNPLGDFKDGIESFNFAQLMNNKTATDIMFISRITISPFSEAVNQEISNNAIAGFVDLELDIYRNPRS